MVDKQVAVRLVVQGGDKAKADFRGVGAAGDQAMQQLGRSAKAGGGALRASAADMSEMGRSGSRLGMQMQNAGYQVGDFFVQVAGGQGAMRAAAQQLPQLLGSFGMWGAIAGAAVAAGAAIIPMMMETDGGAKETEAAMDGLTAATKAYQQAAEELQRPMGDMREQFGANAEAAREVQEILFNLARVRISDAQAAIGEGIDDQLSSLRAYVEEYYRLNTVDVASVGGDQNNVLQMQLALVERIRDQYGMSLDEATLIVTRIHEMNSAMQDGSEQDKAIAMQELSAALADGLDNGIGLSEEMKILVEQVAQAAMEQMEFAARTADAEAAAKGVASVDIAGNIGAGADEAGRLAGNLAAAGDAARFLAAQRALATAGEVSSGRGGDPRTSSQQGYGEFGRKDVDAIIAEEAKKMARASGGGRRRGGAGREKADGYENAMDRTRDQIDRLKAEAAAYAEAAAAGTDYGDAVEFAKKKAELLAAAQKQGMAITPQLTKQIEAQAQAYVTASQSAEQARQSAEELARSSERGRDAMMGIFGAVLDGSDAAKQAVADLLMEIAKIQMQKGLMGLFDNLGGGGFFDVLGGLLSGARAGGGGVKAGGAYLVNEDTPRSEVFVPSQNGAILNVAQAQAALRGQSMQSGGGGGQTVIQLDLSPDLEARFLQRAGAQSVQIQQAADRRLPDRIKQINAAPRRR